MTILVLIRSIYMQMFIAPTKLKIFINFMETFRRFFFRSSCILVAPRWPFSDIKMHISFSIMMQKYTEIECELIIFPSVAFESHWNFGCENLLCACLCVCVCDRGSFVLIKTDLIQKYDRMCTITSGNGVCVHVCMVDKKQIHVDGS